MMSVSRVCPVRCFCGHEVQSCYTRYCAELRGGATVAEALDRSGVPNSSPFAPLPGAPGAYASPPNVCCRAMLMCNSDLSEQHNLLQLVVRWAEGDGSAPRHAAPPPPPPPPAIHQPLRAASPALLGRPAPSMSSQQIIVQATGPALPAATTLQPAQPLAMDQTAH